jgi:methylenetetrahydrofolate--tRNA-(uracil-5-)-methyltransferase
MGALINYITHSETVPFQPMNINFGLFPPLQGRGREKRQQMSKRALEEMRQWKEAMGI